MTRAARFLAVAILLTGGCANGSKAQLMRRLDTALRSGDSISGGPALAKAAIDAGPAAVPMLRNRLRIDDEEIQTRAAMALAYIGGDAAVAALDREFARRRDTTTKSLLCAALPTRGTAEDREFLIRSLAGEHFGDGWPPIVSAALSLGILRAPEARTALEATASRKPSIAGHAARQALLWIRTGRWRVRGIDLRSEENAIIAAVLANGVPRMDEADAFVDRARNGIWRRTGDEWVFMPALTSGKLPEISIVPHLSPDRTRALASVSVTFGPLNAVGYDYVLWKDGPTWRAVALFFTWIS